MPPGVGCDGYIQSPIPSGNRPRELGFTVTASSNSKRPGV